MTLILLGLVIGFLIGREIRRLEKPQPPVQRPNDFGEFGYSSACGKCGQWVVLRGRPQICKCKIGQNCDP